MIDYLILHEVRIGSHRFMKVPLRETLYQTKEVTSTFNHSVDAVRGSGNPNVVTLRT
jgi:hypothetical protein